LAALSGFDAFRKRAGEKPFGFLNATGACV
jgi:hypothetical protein